MQGTHNPPDSREATMENDGEGGLKIDKRGGSINIQEQHLLPADPDRHKSNHDPCLS